MPKREMDLAFTVDERLWRRVELSDIDKGTNRVKPNRLRLQVSVVREKHGSQADVTTERFNGIAETLAGQASEVRQDAVRSVVVDEPTQEVPGHALIAFVALPGEQVEQTTINEARAALSELMTVVVPPTKA